MGHHDAEQFWCKCSAPAMAREGAVLGLHRPPATHLDRLAPSR
jgi:hypothetical protein